MNAHRWRWAFLFEEALERISYRQSNGIPSNDSEFVYRADCVVKQLYQSLSDRLDWPPTKISERYERLAGAIALKVTCNLGGIKVGMCPLITFDDTLHIAGKSHTARGNTQDKFFVLIENVEVVDKPKGIVRRVGGVIRLKSFDQNPDIGICDSLYFSFKSLTPFLSKDALKTGNSTLLGSFTGPTEKCQTT